MIQPPEIPNKYMDIAKSKYARPSAYRSMYALKIALKDDKDFKEKYNEYKKKLSQDTGLRRWLNEKWIQVRPFVEENKIIQCGRDAGDDNPKVPACRPLRRVNSNTPITIGEILKKSSKKEILQEIKKKENDKNYRISWVKHLYE